MPLLTLAGFLMKHCQMEGMQSRAFWPLSLIHILKRRYPHLKGNFGTAWQNQQREFEDIPAPLLFPTNCIMPLRASYADRVFTTSVVAYPGVPHIDEEMCIRDRAHV